MSEITDTAGAVLTPDMAAKSRVSGVWTFTPGGKSHPVITSVPDPSRPEDVIRVSLCGVRMGERSFESELPAAFDCRFCAKLFDAAVEAGPGPAILTVESPDPSPAESGVMVITAPGEHEIALSNQPGTIGVSEAGRVKVWDDPKTYHFEDEPGPFAVTQVMVNEGLFTGAATVNVSGRVHSVVLGTGTGAFQHTQCGVDTDRRGHPVAFVELPAVITCRSCLPLAEARAASPFREATVPELLRQLKEARAAEHRLAFENQELAARLAGTAESLDTGVATWRRKQREMGGKIAAAERELDTARRELALVKDVLAASAGTPQELADRTSQAETVAARWRGIAGVLAWKLGGPGMAQKAVVLSPMEWAAAYGALFQVDGRPLPMGDGQWEVLVSIRPPAPAVTSENDGGRAASEQD